MNGSQCGGVEEREAFESQSRKAEDNLCRSLRKERVPNLGKRGGQGAAFSHGRAYKIREKNGALLSNS